MLKSSRKNYFIKLIELIHKNIIPIIIAVVIISGVSSTLFIVRENSKTEEEKAGIEYVKSDIIYLSSMNVRTLNPITSKDKDVYYISKLIYSSLYDLDDNLGPKKDIVKSYSTDPSEGKVTIYLKDNIKFHDGTTLTTEDVKFTVNTIKEYGSQGVYYIDVNKIEDIYIVNSAQMEIKFKDVYDAALDNLTFPIISSSQVSSSREFIQKEDYRPIGSGKYKFTSYDKYDSLILKPNKDYYGVVPNNTLQFQILPDRNTVLNLVSLGNVTTYISQDEDLDVVAEDKGLRYDKILSNKLDYLGFNFKNKTLKDKNFRKAVINSIDLEEILEKDYLNNGTFTKTIYYPNFLGVNGKENKNSISEPELKLDFEKLGYKDYTGNGFLQDKNKKEVVLRILVNSNDAKRVSAANQIETDLRNVGIKTKIVNVKWTTYKEKMHLGDFDIVLGGYSFNEKYNLKKLFKKGNYLNYYNETVYNSVCDLEKCLSLKELRYAYENLEKLLLNDLSYVPICYRNNSMLSAKTLECSQLPVWNDIYRGCETWSWSKTVVNDKDKR